MVAGWLSRKNHVSTIRTKGPGDRYPIVTTVDLVDVLDTYSGHTDPGGAATRRDLAALSITKLSVGPMDNNAYLLVCKASNEALLIDAANEAERLADLVGAADSRPELRHLVTTHQHWDHWQALGAVAGMFQTRQIAHPLDAPELPIPITSSWSTATPSRSARSSWASCTCAATPPAPSRWSTATTPAPTSSPATRSSRAGRARRPVPPSSAP